MQNCTGDSSSMSCSDSAVSKQLQSCSGNSRLYTGHCSPRPLWSQLQAVHTPCKFWCQIFICDFTAKGCRQPAAPGQDWPQNVLSFLL